MQVTYTNKKPAYYLNRQFKIVCSEMSRRFVSNEYQQTLTVIHPPLPPMGDEKGGGHAHQGPAHPAAAAAAGHSQLYQPKHAHRGLDEQSVDEVGFTSRRNFVHSIGNGQSHSKLAGASKRVNFNCRQCVAISRIT